MEGGVVVKEEEVGIATILGDEWLGLKGDVLLNAQMW